MIAICVGASLITAKLFTPSKSAWEHDMSHGHQWLHEALELTEEEAVLIDAFEVEYRNKRNVLIKDFDARISELRDILVNNDKYMPGVDAAIHRLHNVHGKLQELSIQHYYDMLNVLPSDKQEKLRQLAVTALSEPE
jgi:hypothetical protein